MTEVSKEDRLAVIISYLKQQGAALATIDRRMESLGADLKMIGDSVRDISRRQSELEGSSSVRQGACREVMDNLANRIFSLEQMITPIPKRITSRDLISSFPEAPMAAATDGNGADEEVEQIMFIDETDDSNKGNGIK